MLQSSTVISHKTKVTGPPVWKFKIPRSLVHVVFSPEEAHLVGAIAHHGGRGAAPHAPQPLLAQDGGGAVDGVLRGLGVKGRG
jgi:hypothetical protein